MSLLALWLLPKIWLWIDLRTAQEPVQRSKENFGLYIVYI